MACVLQSLERPGDIILEKVMSGIDINGFWCCLKDLKLGYVYRILVSDCTSNPT